MSSGDVRYSHTTVEHGRFSNSAKLRVHLVEQPDVNEIDITLTVGDNP